MTSEELILQFEGIKLDAYKCPAGVWTIGIGTTQYTDGKPVKQGDSITKEQAFALLNDWLNKNSKPLLQKIPYTLKSCQITALESLIYNTGAGLPTRCPKLWNSILKKDWKIVYKEWDFGINNGLNGIIKRRATELKMFMDGI